MTDKQRISALEKQVSQLNRKLDQLTKKPEATLIGKAKISKREEDVMWLLSLIPKVEEILKNHPDDVLDFKMIIQKTIAKIIHS